MFFVFCFSFSVANTFHPIPLSRFHGQSHVQLAVRSHTVTTPVSDGQADTTAVTRSPASTTSLAQGAASRLDFDCTTVPVARVVRTSASEMWLCVGKEGEGRCGVSSRVSSLCASNWRLSPRLQLALSSLHTHAPTLHPALSVLCEVQRVGRSARQQRARALAAQRARAQRAGGQARHQPRNRSSQQFEGQHTAGGAWAFAAGFLGLLSPVGAGAAAGAGAARGAARGAHGKGDVCVCVCEVWGCFH